MFWNKKPTVDLPSLDMAFQGFHLALKEKLEHLHATYLSDKAVLGETAIDSFIVSQMYLVGTHTNLPKVENGGEVWDGCLIRHSFFLAEQYEIDEGSFKDTAGNFYSVWQITFDEYKKFVENYTGRNAVVDFLYENVYKKHNVEFSIPNEAQEIFKEEYVPISTKLMVEVNAALINSK